MKKQLFLSLVLCLPLISFAETEVVKQLQKKCANEQSSTFKDTRGTPSCDQLDRIHYGKRTPNHSTVELQRKCENEQSSTFKDTRGTPSCDQLDRLYQYQRPQPTTTTIIAPQTDTLEYWYEGDKYCGHTSNGETIHCY